ncbi:MAG: hypothetical protein AB1730_26400 [Myxococcota bacterium]|jgi:hypothetical protein
MSRELTWAERAFIRVERSLGEVTHGYFITFDEELIRQHGLMGFFRWARATLRAQNELIAAFGETKFHLLAGFASLWNGCDYCAYGHVLALNLCVFKETGQLFPIDEAEVHELLRLRDHELQATLEARLGASHPELFALVKRQLEVRVAEGPLQSDEDRLILKSIALYEWVNECSITVDAPAPPLGPIAKDRELRARYAAARAEARTSKVAAPAPVSAPSEP